MVWLWLGSTADPQKCQLNSGSRLGLTHRFSTNKVGRALGKARFSRRSLLILFSKQWTECQWITRMAAAVSRSLILTSTHSPTIRSPCVATALWFVISLLNITRRFSKLHLRQWLSRHRHRALQVTNSTRLWISQSWPSLKRTNLWHLIQRARKNKRVKLNSTSRVLKTTFSLI